MNNDDFDVVKKGDIHKPSYDAGEINAVKELLSILKEAIKEMEELIKEKEST